MPESGNVHPAITVIDAIDDAIRADDNLADGWISELGHDSAHLGKISEALGAADKKLAESNGALR